MKSKNQPVDITVELRVYIARTFKTQCAAAAWWGLTPAYVSMILSGKKKPTDKMLEDAGYALVQPEATYVRVKK